jgi:hypothetical protein
MVATTKSAVRRINAAPGNRARRNRSHLANDLAASRRTFRIGSVFKQGEWPLFQSNLKSFPPFKQRDFRKIWNFINEQIGYRNSPSTNPI